MTRAVSLARRALESAACLLLFRFLVGGLLLFAASYKVRAPQVFALSIEAYRMVPPALVPALAYLVIWNEIVAGACVIAGIWTRASALLCAALYGAFTVAILRVLLSGMSITCGCFGDLSDEPIGWVSVARNLAFLAMAAWLLARGGGRYSLDFLISRKRM